MNLSNSRSFGLLSRIRLRPGLAFGVIIILALGAFEMFNYSTTEFALNDLLGNLKFFSISWATILSIAFCGIDFAGIARLFTPEQGADEPREVWYLFAAWLLAATMNAILTWWGVSMAIANHKVSSTAIMDNTTLTRIVPIFVAVMVWVIRILIIGTLSVTGERIFNADRRAAGIARSRATSATASSVGLGNPGLSPRPAISRPIMNRPVMSADASLRPEPTYHSMSAAARLSPRGEAGDPPSSENRKL